MESCWKQTIDSVYLVADDVTAKYYTEDGEENLSRHPRNDRCQEVVLEEYEKGILQRGVLQFARGRPVVVQILDSSKFHLVTNASLTAALYRANRKYPENPQVAASIAAGLQHCKVLHAQTPEDVIDWYRDRHK